MFFFNVTLEVNFKANLVGCAIWELLGTKNVFEFWKD